MKPPPFGLSVDELRFVLMARELSPAQMTGVIGAIWKLVGPGGQARPRRQGITPPPGLPGLDEQAPPPPVDPSPRSGRRPQLQGGASA